MMPLFSERNGYKSLAKALQREAADEELRNRLWSVLLLVVWDRWASGTRHSYERELVDRLLDMIWLDFFKRPLDTSPEFKSRYGEAAYKMLREYFFECKWYEVYDFIEFVIRNIPKEWASVLRNACNRILEEENSAYRIIDDKVIEITDEVEIKAVDEALNSPLRTITLHLERALELMADKKAPDYRNSIKESISAVEAACRFIAGDEKATLGQALKEIGKKVDIHPALERGFLALYGFTSDSGGIRHALTDSSSIPSYADAKFMLVACSGFINFLLTKAAEAGINVG